MMVIDNKYEIGQFVYLSTDPDQNKRIITDITIKPNQLLIYHLNFGSTVSDHYEFEISDKIDQVFKNDIMKELLSHQKESITNSRNAEQKKTLFQGELKMIPGHKCYQLCLATLDIEEVNYDEVAVKIDGTLRRKLVAKKGFLYTVALNAKNTERKFIARLNKVVEINNNLKK